MNKNWYKVFFKILIATCSLYGCFIIGKYIYFLTFEWNQNLSTAASMIGQIIIQVLLLLSAILALKQKNILPICFTILPLLFLNLAYFSPSGIMSITSLSKNIEQYHNEMFFFLITDIIIVGIIFLLTYTEIGICIYRIVKNKSPKPTR